MRALALLATVVSLAITATARADDPKDAKPSDAKPADAKADATKPKPDPTLAMRARPEPLADMELPTKPVPWQRYAEIGGDFALVQRPVSSDGLGAKTNVRLRPAPGFGIHGGFDIIRNLRFVAYFIDSHHDLMIPAGSLGYMGTIRSDAVATYSLGARLAPTLPLGDRGRIYVTAGIGWGRLEYPMIDNAQLHISRRADSFAEAPLGFGASVEIIKRWLLVDVNATGAVIFGQEGSARDAFQGFDKTTYGTLNVGSLPKLDATFTETLGLVLVL